LRMPLMEKQRLEQVLSLHSEQRLSVCFLKVVPISLVLK
jgi:hypothetical protein